MKNIKLAMFLIVSVVIATSCKKESTCDYEKDNLDAAQTEETRINNEFNLNADSCIHYWAPQMPAAFLSTAYGNLQNIATPPYTKKDSVTTLNNYASAVPAQYQDEKVKGIIRTGGKALTAWDACLNAQTITQSAQTALTECQNSND